MVQDELSLPQKANDLPMVDTLAPIQSPEAGFTDLSNYIGFPDFFEFGFVPCNGLSLPVKDIHRQVCRELEMAVLAEESPFQFYVINIPPRVGKTKICEALACWMTAYFPDAQAIYSSYSSTLVERSIKYIGETIQRTWFQETFGDFLHTKSAQLITTREGGQIYGAGTGASITGFGAGLKRPAGGFIVVDDPAKPDEALSPVESENIRQWFETTLKSRRNSDKFCPIIIVAQRLAPEDLCGYILQTYPKLTKLIKFPAMVNEVSVIPETISTESLQALKATRTGRFVLASQYQQEPVAFGGNIIQPANFHRWDPATPMKWDKRVITCDTALKAKQSNDFSVLQLWGKHNNRAYLIDQARGKWESPALLENATAFWEKCVSDPLAPRPRLIIEEKAAGSGLIQQMCKIGIPAEGIERSIDKVQRVQAILPFIETGLVFVPKDGSVPWVDAFLTECAQFQADGTAPHDDQVDCLVDGVEQLLGRSLSIFDVLRQKK